MNAYLSDAVPQIGIEGGGSEDDLREHGGGFDFALETDTFAVP